MMSENPACSELEGQLAKRTTNLSHIFHKARVKPSRTRGRGLFAVEPIGEGGIVAIKGGYIFGRATLGQIEKRLGPAEIPVADGCFIGPSRMEERDGGMVFSNHDGIPSVGFRAHA